MLVSADIGDHNAAPGAIYHRTQVVAAPIEPKHYADSGFSCLRCDSVKISTPFWVTPTECSNCADSERSRVTAVQPSDRILTCGLPRLIIGSMVKNMPGFSVTPSPGRPMWMMFGSSWNM